MKKSNIRPNWWLLCIMCADVMGIFWLEISVPFTSTGHILAEICLVLILFGFVASWLKANELALSQMDQEERKPRSK